MSNPPPGPAAHQLHRTLSEMGAAAIQDLAERLRNEFAELLLGQHHSLLGSRPGPRVNVAVQTEAAFPMHDHHSKEHQDEVSASALVREVISALKLARHKKEQQPKHAQREKKEQFESARMREETLRHGEFDKQALGRAFCAEEEQLTRAQREDQEMLEHRHEAQKCAEAEKEQLEREMQVEKEFGANKERHEEELQRLQAERERDIDLGRQCLSTGAVIGPTWLFQAGESELVRCTLARGRPKQAAEIVVGHSCLFQTGEGATDESGADTQSSCFQMHEEYCIAQDGKRCPTHVGSREGRFMGFVTAIMLQLRDWRPDAEAGLGGQANLAVETASNKIMGRDELHRFSNLLFRSAFRHHVLSCRSFQCELERNEIHLHAACNTLQGFAHSFPQIQRCGHHLRCHLQNSWLQVHRDFAAKQRVPGAGLNKRLQFQGKPFHTAKQIGSEFVWRREKTFQRPQKKDHHTGSHSCDTLVAPPGRVQKFRHAHDHDRSRVRCKVRRHTKKQRARTSKASKHAKGNLARTEVAVKQSLQDKDALEFSLRGKEATQLVGHGDKSVRRLSKKDNHGGNRLCDAPMVPRGRKGKFRYAHHHYCSCQRVTSLQRQALGHRKQTLAKALQDSKHSLARMEAALKQSRHEKEALECSLHDKEEKVLEEAALREEQLRCAQQERHETVKRAWRALSSKDEQLSRAKQEKENVLREAMLKEEKMLQEAALREKTSSDSHIGTFSLLCLLFWREQQLQQAMIEKEKMLKEKKMPEHAWIKEKAWTDSEVEKFSILCLLAWREQQLRQTNIDKEKMLEQASLKEGSLAWSYVERFSCLCLFFWRQQPPRKREALAWKEELKKLSAEKEPRQKVCARILTWWEDVAAVRDGKPIPRAADNNDPIARMVAQCCSSIDAGDERGIVDMRRQMLECKKMLERVRQELQMDKNLNAKHEDKKEVEKLCQKFRMDEELCAETAASCEEALERLHTQRQGASVGSTPELQENDDAHDGPTRPEIQPPHRAPPDPPTPPRPHEHQLTPPDPTTTSQPAPLTRRSDDIAATDDRKCPPCTNGNNDAVANSSLQGDNLFSVANNGSISEPPLSQEKITENSDTFKMMLTTCCSSIDTADEQRIMELRRKLLECKESLENARRKMLEAQENLRKELQINKNLSAKQERKQDLQKLCQKLWTLEKLCSEKAAACETALGRLRKTRQQGSPETRAGSTRDLQDNDDTLATATRPQTQPPYTVASPDPPARPNTHASRTAMSDPPTQSEPLTCRSDLVAMLDDGKSHPCTGESTDAVASSALQGDRLSSALDNGSSCAPSREWSKVEDVGNLPKQFTPLSLQQCPPGGLGGQGRPGLGTVARWIAVKDKPNEFKLGDLLCVIALHLLVWFGNVPLHDWGHATASERSLWDGAATLRHEPKNCLEITWIAVLPEARLEAFRGGFGEKLGVGLSERVLLQLRPTPFNTTVQVRLLVFDNQVAKDVVQTILQGRGTCGNPRYSLHCEITAIVQELRQILLQELQRNVQWARHCGLLILPQPAPAGMRPLPFAFAARKEPRRICPQYVVRRILQAREAVGNPQNSPRGAVKAFVHELWHNWRRELQHKFQSARQRGLIIPRRQTLVGATPLPLPCGARRHRRPFETALFETRLPEENVVRFEGEQGVVPHGPKGLRGLADMKDAKTEEEEEDDAEEEDEDMVVFKDLKNDCIARKLSQAKADLEVAKKKEKRAREEDAVARKDVALLKDWVPKEDCNCSRCARRKLLENNMVLERQLRGKDEQLRRMEKALKCAQQEKDEVLKNAWRELCSKEKQLRLAKEETQECKAEQEKLRQELQINKKMCAEQAACCEMALEKLRTQKQTMRSPTVELAWEFQGNDGKWVPYTSASSETITRSFLQGEKSCSLVHDGSSYEILLHDKEMLQINCATGKCRKIRFTTGVPAHWSVGNGTIIQQLRGGCHSAPDGSPTAQGGLGTLGSLKLESILKPITEKKKLQEFTNLLRKSVFHHHDWQDPHSRCDKLGSKFLVCEAYQVQNFLLYQGYRNHCQHLRSKHVQTGVMPQRIWPDVPSVLWDLGEQLGIADTALNERVLLHGTSFDVAKQIALEGFDSRTAKPNGMYGQGTYFASQSCKSNQYTKWEPLHTVLLARVALGDPHYAERCDRTVRRPPKKENTVGSPLCDSLIAVPGWMEGHKDKWQSHMEFVIFEQMQAYPEYILRYRLASA